MKIPKVEYDVYCKLTGKNLIKLNLTVCENSKVKLSVPVELTESLDKLNGSSGYYNDICYTATSDSGTDISLKDRKNEFVEGNKTVCQDNCEFSEYDYTNKKAKCSCKVKESKTSILDMKIDKDELFKQFTDVQNFANINLLHCYKVLFSKKGIKSNIACFSIIPINIIHLICIILFYTKQKKTLDFQVKDITFAIDNWKLVKEYEKEVSRTKKTTKENKTKPKKKNKVFKKTINDNNNQMIILPSPIDYYFFSRLLNKHNNPPKKKVRIIKQNINLNSRLQRSSNLKTTGFIQPITNSKKGEIINKSRQIMSYNDEELNNLPYDLALRFDNRTYCEYYISLIKINHIIIFSFFYSKDYNSRVVKMDFFFVSFVIYFAINALFFNDNTMHKIYEDQGYFNIKYQLPQIAYSFLISFVLNLLLKLVALSEGNILTFKKNKNKTNLTQREKNLKKLLDIKFIIYFIISTIFLIFFWYYLSMFCAIYSKTQYHLIKDTLISFGLSLLYPFGIYLLPGLFRIPALSDRNNKRKYLYHLSKVFQMI